MELGDSANRGMNVIENGRSVIHYLSWSLNPIQTINKLLKIMINIQNDIGPRAGHLSVENIRYMGTPLIIAIILHVA